MFLVKSMNRFGHICEKMGISFNVNDDGIENDDVKLGEEFTEQVMNDKLKQSPDDTLNGSLNVGNDWKESTGRKRSNQNDDDFLVTTPRSFCTVDTNFKSSLKKKKLRNSFGDNPKFSKEKSVNLSIGDKNGKDKNKNDMNLSCTLENLPLSNGDSSDVSNEYEVECIKDYVEDEGEDYYLVKWKGWRPSHNSWEPIQNLKGCKAYINKYHRKYPKTSMPEYEQVKKSMDTKNLRKNVRVISALVSQIMLEKSQSYKKCKSEIYKKYIVNSIQHKDVEYCVQMPEGKKKITMNADLFKKYHVLKQEYDVKLKAWEDSINRVSTDKAPIIVVNEVDFEPIPQNFTYINDYEPGKGVVIPDDPLVGCECKNCFQDKKRCCGHQSLSSFAYNNYRQVNVPPGTPIYECNKRCHCGSNCTNRVVQFGRKIKLAIFRTNNMCGWGVKTLQQIPRGTFVMEYVGEVISDREAEKRGHKYDADGRTYLFDLDYDDSDSTYTVDAAFKGNISHFMNHSCTPNLAVYGVWINNLDPRLPRLAFFSTRRIKKGEELSFDYMMSAVGKSEANSSKSLITSPMLNKNHKACKRVLCKCRSTQCRKYLF